MQKSPAPITSAALLPVGDTVASYVVTPGEFVSVVQAGEAAGVVTAFAHLDALAPLGKIAHSFDQIDFLVKAIIDAAKPGDHILVMSNGGFGGIHEKILKRLA